MGDDETIANIFARAYSETGSIADAYRVTSAILNRGSTHDIAAIGLDSMIAEVATFHGVSTRDLLGTSKRPEITIARFHVWWRCRQRNPPLSYPALGAYLHRDHSTVISGVQKFERLMAESAELRARVIWEAAERQQAA